MRTGHKWLLVGLALVVVVGVASVAWVWAADKVSGEKAMTTALLAAVGAAPVAKAEDADDDDEDEVKVTIDQVPAAVKDAILKAAAGNAIKEIEMETEDGKTVYEAEWVVDGKEIEIEVAPDGTVLKQKVEDADDDEDDDEDGDDDDEDEDEDEVEVTIDQVPAAVKAAILNAAAGNPIKEIEMETEDGKTVYEAEWVVDGKEIEIEVAPDGTVLKQKVEDADDDEDDDDK